MSSAWCCCCQREAEGTLSLCCCTRSPCVLKIVPNVKLNAHLNLFYLGYFGKIVCMNPHILSHLLDWRSRLNFHFLGGSGNGTKYTITFTALVGVYGRS